MIGWYGVATTVFRVQTYTLPSSTNTRGTPRPTAIMLMTNGEMESMGGEPVPAKNVLQETR